MRSEYCGEWESRFIIGDYTMSYPETGGKQE